MNANELEARFTETEQSLQESGITFKDQMVAVRFASEEDFYTKSGTLLLETGTLYWKAGEPYFYDNVTNKENKADCVYIKTNRNNAKLINAAFQNAGFKTEQIDVSHHFSSVEEGVINIVVNFYNRKNTMK